MSTTPKVRVSMASWARRALLGVVAFDRALQSLQRVRPEFLEHLAYRRQGISVEAVQPAGAHSALLQQAGLLQHRQVLAHRLLREREVRRDLSGRELAVPNEADDLAPVRVGERPQDRIGRCGALRVEGWHQAVILPVSRAAMRL